MAEASWPSPGPSAAETAPPGTAPHLPKRAQNAASLSPFTRRRSPLPRAHTIATAPAETRKNPSAPVADCHG